MKKILILLAATMLVFACGGSDKKETVEQKAARYMKAYLEAEAAGDYEKAAEIKSEMKEWGSSLSEDELNKANAAADKAEEEWNAAKLEKITEEAARYVKAYLEAEFAGDYEKAAELMSEMKEWGSSLSEDELNKANAAADKAEEEWNAAKLEKITEKAAKFATQVCEAQAAGDEAKVMKIQDELQSWAEGLSYEELEKAEIAYMEAVEKWVDEHEEEFGGNDDYYGGESEYDEEDDWESETDCYIEECLDEDEYVDVEAIAKKAARYNERMLKALLNGDMDAVEEIQAEGDAWYNSLSDAEQEVVDEATEQWMEEHADELEELL